MKNVHESKKKKKTVQIKSKTFSWIHTAEDFATQLITTVKTVQTDG
jgi:hypothetical protein